jgi:hypothetical protein
VGLLIWPIVTDPAAIELPVASDSNATKPVSAKRFKPRRWRMTIQRP